MTLTLADLEFLVSKPGDKLLTDLANEDLSEQNTLKLISALRKTYAHEQVAAAMTMARLRQKAVEKFGSDARWMYFTRAALQQASHPLVRQYRVRLGQANRVADVCCGIGSDSLAFAQDSLVFGYDIDPVRIRIAQLNAHVLDVLTVTFELKDVTALPPESFRDSDLVFYDPSRRDASGKRIFDVERYIPPLSLIEQWDAPQIMVKLAPGVDVAQLQQYGGEITFISVNGEMKEAVLHIGGESSGLRAVLLAGEQVHEWRRHGDEPDVPFSAPQGWLCEPDPALLRANMVRDIVHHLDGFMLDETIAYFTTRAVPQSVWVHGWRVLDWMPFNLKRLRAYLQERNIGTLTVKKRGSPITPEELIQKLKLKGSASCTLVLTRYQGAPIVIICDSHN